MGSTDSDSLQPKLDEAHKKLETALDEACADDVKEADTGELIRIEETLAAASKAAKEAVSIRLRRRQERSKSTDEAPEEPPADTAAPAAPAAPEEVSVDNPHRVFEDIRGIRWHAFAVHPSSERSALPEPYRAGWLAFESENEMRRVAPIPSNWKEVSVDELRELCHKAEVAPKRVNSIDVSTLTPRKVGRREKGGGRS
jgi:hypothetical protein